ncbi:MAG: hypothetical protein KUF77_06200 [Candidatus Thiodiazotropha sp. (ex Lucina aurantia)]|uniref:Uncharacterized protein n=1 Tax=Candidatus Thiodiazotropha taylori TaxID=2792791 RepID=A0A9E4NMH9_9GAMM|nr:hypothetical protein [Candidatus Thiodiazotropha sp. (ex Lucina pensylvanica)]MBT3014106.1 hypothetical protein [Candidatus Thiodiazotropha taylori]MBT3037808.1 hypothetical protein [Candidatus Thiodiazotropha sp. (ex Codakia orbicularis)]MBV2102599.1 hypothetical protein [Candidatus Thiodiazotropha sp. (ex Lucina aurantia)]MCG7862053.1 hypothetical protein [Candidatus Thiodiazotropha endolucinida]MCU7943680.1 hypothetical protein [Candidatus Thiodiazotropha sp. (ex Cardiolucina cf. quadrat
MLNDPLTAKYLFLFLIAIWGVLVIISAGRRYGGYMLGALFFLLIAYIALGSGFSIRIPYLHNKMEILVYTIHNERVHALAHPLGKPGEPLHIVFSIDQDTEGGGKMRKTFFDAVRAREGRRHKTNIIIDMRGYMTDQGDYKYQAAPAFPPKQ